MAPELTRIPFDQYQRYAGAARVVSAISGEVRSVLEVGANRQKLLGRFLPGRVMTYTDVVPQEDDANFLVADACALPFADRSYDAVISLDMLEHVAPDARDRAVAESARVCARVVVIACPTDRPWVHAAEDAADAVWRRHFDASYPWLAEHKVHGLVDPEQVERVLVAQGLHVVRIAHGEAGLWAALMGAHFAKEVVPELAGVVASLDRWYNEVVFEHDVSATSYRELIVGLRDPQDRDRVAALAVAPPGPHPAVEGLKALAESLLPAVERTRTAERGWEQAAEMWRASQAELGAARSELDAAQARLQDGGRSFAEHVRESLRPLIEGADSRVAKVQEEVHGIHSDLDDVRSQWGEADLRYEVQSLHAGMRGLRRLLLVGVSIATAGAILALAVLAKVI